MLFVDSSQDRIDFIKLLNVKFCLTSINRTHVSFRLHPINWLLYRKQS